MTTFRENQYNPPGVYVGQNDQPSSGRSLGVSPSVVAVIGPSQGFRRHSEAVVLNATTAVTLAKQGIMTASVVVTNESGTPYAVTDDYTVAQTAGEDGELGAAEDNPTTITRVTNGDISSGATVFVSYEFADASQFEPRRFEDPDDIQAFYGAPFESDGYTVRSPLTLAGHIALNTAGEVMLVATRPPDEVDRPDGWEGPFTTAARLSSGYAKILNNAAVAIVVPLPVGITGSLGVTIGSPLTSHVSSAIANGTYRTAVLGAERTSTEEGDAVAGGVNQRETLLIWPQATNYLNRQRNLVMEVAGYYMAVEVAAIATSNRPQEPLTQKRLPSFPSIPQRLLQGLTRSAKDVLSSNGVSVAEPGSNGGLVIRHGVTTKVGSIYEREFSLVRAEQTIITRMLSSLVSSGFVGGVLNLQTITGLKATVVAILDQLMAQGTIQGYRDVKLRVTGTDPSVVEVKFAYGPSFPLNYIIVSFGIDASTGNLVEVSEAA